MHVSELQTLHISKLLEMAEEHGIENANRFRKQDLVFAIVRQMMKQGESFTCSGTLEILPDGFGFLRSADTSYHAGPNDIYVSPTQIRRFNLHTGDTIEGSVRVPKDNERYFALVRLDSINGDHPEVCKHKILFENLTPLFPTKQFKLERDIKAEENLTGRAIDLVSPIGRGQRALLVAPPKTGKTVMLQNIAHAITANYPDVELIVLLIDERPEEVTEMSRSVRGEVVSSTFDEPAQRHVQVAEMVILQTSTPWHPLMACTLFIVPGVPIINFVNDVLDNNIEVGIIRGINTILIVSAMAFGIVIAIRV